MFKKALIFLVIMGLLAGTVYLVRSGNLVKETQTSFTPVEETFIPNESLLRLSGTGFHLLQENGNLALYLNFDDGNIQVVNKLNGHVWRSCPTEEEMALETSNQMWKNNLSSAVMFTYTAGRSSTNIKYANPLSVETKVNVFQKEKGARVYFEFPSLRVTFGYDILLEDDRLCVDIPSYLITDPGEVYTLSASGTSLLNAGASCLVVDFFLFPSLGATRSDMGHKGYLLVPDGEGALMQFDTDKFVNSQFIGRVYGSDMALYNGYDQQLSSELSRPVISFPAFGVVQDDNTLLTVIDRGETQADIVASKARVQTGFNTVGARFAYRMKYKVVTNSATGDGYLSYTRDGLQDARRLCYYFGTGSYVDMAQTYRGYLMDRYTLSGIIAKGAKALQLYILGGDVQSNLLGESFIPMTTFDQARDILAYLKQQGVGQVDAVLTGWAKRGESVSYPDRFPAAGALGGDEGLTKLAEAAKAQGDNLYLLDSSLMLHSLKGIRLRTDVVYNIQANPLFEGAFANAMRMAEDFTLSLPTFRRYGVSGLQETSLGWLLLTDYSLIAPTTREQMKQAQRDLLLDINREFGGLRLDSSHAYALMDGVTLTYMPSNSYLSILDESVPFYSIALHGLVDYVYGDYMDFYEPQRQMLEAVSRGGSISFTVSHEPTENLQRAQSARYFSTQFDQWKEDIVRIYARLQGYGESTAGSFITGYAAFVPGVVLTTYGNGVRVLVNFTGEPTMFEGRKVDAEDFIVLEGGDKGAQ